MRNIVFAVLGVVLMSGAARAELDLSWHPPDRTDYVLLAVHTLFIAGDVATTLHFRAAGEKEGNFLLGTRPSAAQVVLIGGVAASVAAGAAWYALPTVAGIDLRKCFSIALIGVEGGIISWNLSTP